MSRFDCLDLNEIQLEISKLASISEAQDFICNEEVDFNPLVIKNKSAEVNEALKLLNNQFNVHFSGIVNVNDLFEKANKDITLTGNELNSTVVFHNHCERIKKQFSSIDENLKLKDYTDSININSNIFNKIQDCIENNGDIKSDASDLLRTINKNIETLDKQIYSKAQQFISKNAASLQEQTAFTRENRVVFLVKNSDKNKFSGYAYGSSSSGLACYVEPGFLVELNNEMISLYETKQDEENRILKELSYLVASVYEEYKHNFDCLLNLNVIFAKANYGYKHNCIIPEFNNSIYFEFKDLAHPLLDENKVVCNTYRLFEPYKGIVISGSNTGGKTVSLKAIGLSLIMSYIGIPIIASYASVPIYKNIFVDIDDNQSIKDSLSTFSAHISNINNILNNSNDRCLILIDELISGTDPKQAQAISLSIMDKIKEIGSCFIITTHFDDIKNYSYKDENILLSSVGFNMDTLKPTYKYLEDSIGSSNALEIASRYFDDQDIINNAKKYLKENQTKQDELLNQLSNEINNVSKQKEKVDDVLKENENLQKIYNDKIKEFENEKLNLKNKYLEELNSFIEDIKSKAIEKLNSINDKKDNKVLSELDHIVEKDIEVNTTNVNFNLNDNVRIKDNEQIGTIIELNDKKATVDLRGIKVKVDINDLTLMPKIIKKKVFKEKSRICNVAKEINLVGQRVEDGLILMEEYLDKANGANLSSVKVIHGIGSGALRNALRNRMKKLSYVSSFKDGDFYDGGSAVTIVEFKK